jgi:hypothetical protein
MTDFDREEVMRQWDSWRKYIAEGGGSSWPRDAFEDMLDFFDEQQAEIERLREEIDRLATEFQKMTDHLFRTRSDALEEAAKVALRFGPHDGHRIAEAIRALKEKRGEKGDR